MWVNSIKLIVLSLDAKQMLGRAGGLAKLSWRHSRPRARRARSMRTRMTRKRKSRRSQQQKPRLVQTSGVSACLSTSVMLYLDLKEHLDVRQTQLEIPGHQCELVEKKGVDGDELDKNWWKTM